MLPAQSRGTWACRRINSERVAGTEERGCRRITSVCCRHNPEEHGPVAASIHRGTRESESETRSHKIQDSVPKRIVFENLGKFLGIFKIL